MARNADAQQIGHVVRSAFGKRHDVVGLPLARLQLDTTTTTAATLTFKRMLTVLGIRGVFVCLAVRVAGIAFSLIDSRLMVWAVVAK